MKPKIHSRSFAPSDLAKFGRYFKDKPKRDAADGDFDSTDGPEVCYQIRGKKKK